MPRSRWSMSALPQTERLQPETISTIIAGGHLRFRHRLRQAGLVGGAESAPDGEGHKRRQRGLTRGEWRRSQSRPSSVWRRGNRPLLLRRSTGTPPVDARYLRGDGEMDRGDGKDIAALV